MLNMLLIPLIAPINPSVAPFAQAGISNPYLPGLKR